MYVVVVCICTLSSLAIMQRSQAIDWKSMIGVAATLGIKLSVDGYDCSGSSSSVVSGDVMLVVVEELDKWIEIA